MMTHAVVEMVFGSQLYGTATADSDTDVKGVFAPSHRDALLGRLVKSVQQNTKQDTSQKNSAADSDREFYGLHYFMELAVKGETVALDMLHAPAAAWRQTSDAWQLLVDNRRLFYTKNLRSLVEYARHQAAKYGVKGSRLAEAKRVLAVLEAAEPREKVGNILATLPAGEHCGPVYDGNVAVLYQCCGKRFTLGAKVAEYVPTMQRFVEEYGGRARLAEANQGVDWKALSHAFRAAYQVRAILTAGDFTFPLAETAFLRDVKSGTLPYKAVVGPMLDELLDEVNDLARASTLPEAVDQIKADALLLAALDRAWAS